MMEKEVDYIDYDGVKAERTTEFFSGPNHQLCIRQEGDRIFLTKSMIEKLPEMVERWKIE